LNGEETFVRDDSWLSFFLQKFFFGLQSFVAHTGLSATVEKMGVSLETLTQRLLFKDQAISMVNASDPEFRLIQQVTDVYSALSKGEQKDYPEDRATRLEHFFSLVAKLTYEEVPTAKAAIARWGTDFIIAEEIAQRTEVDNFVYRTKAMILISEASQSIVIAFRGTRPWSLAEWGTDFASALTCIMPENPSVKVHVGFAYALGLADNKENQISRTLLGYIKKHPKKKLYITGHSLGAALASVFLFACAIIEHLPVEGVYTYGQPRVGNQEYARMMDTALDRRLHRVVNHNDIVTRVPLHLPGISYFDFHHHGTLRYLDKGNQISMCYNKGKKTQTQPSLSILHLKYKLFHIFGLDRSETTLRRMYWFWLPVELNDHFPGDYERRLRALL